MTDVPLKFRGFVLLIVVGLIISGCDQQKSPIEISLPDLSDPAADVTYGVETIPYDHNLGCFLVFNGLTLRPPNHDSLHLVRGEVMDEHQLTDYIAEYVLNHDVLPQYAENPRQAYIRLVDSEERETAWRACTVELIRTAYYRIWNKAARDYYQMEYAQLPRWHKECVLKEYPLMVVAAGPWMIPPPPPPPPPFDGET